MRDQQLKNLCDESIVGKRDFSSRNQNFADHFSELSGVFFITMIEKAATKNLRDERPAAEVHSTCHSVQERI